MITNMMLWSFSPLSRWTPRDSRYRQELAGSAPLGAVGGRLAGTAGRGPGRGWRMMRLMRVLAKRRLYKRRP